MKKLNQNGFAISTVIYGLSIMGIMIVAILLAVMAQNRSNTRQLSKTVEDELNSLSKNYQEKLEVIEYITGDGSHYIDTGYYPKPTTGVFIDYQFDDLTQQQRLFSATTNLFYEIYICGGDEWAYIFNDGNNTTDYKWTGVAVDKLRHQIYFNDKNDKKYKIDNRSYESFIGSASYTSGNTIKILASGGASYKAKAKIYSFKIYEEGTLVHDFIPVKREYDNLEGLYDKNDKKFHTLNHTIEEVPDSAITLP